MNVEGHADKLIRGATERGEMDAAGAGQPLGALTNDPDWWIRAFLERELIPDRYEEMRASIDRRVASAVEQDTLDDARALLAQANADATRWNAEAPADFQIAEVSEIDLVTRRAQRPAR
ncbi:MAG: DnaJ family domain-containing protein [Acidimicrobiia bacterium]